MVLSSGESISITHASGGTLTSTWVSPTEREYKWNNELRTIPESRTIPLRPRVDRWYGSYGVYSQGYLRYGVTFTKTEDGVTRICADEGRQYFRLAEDAVKWANHWGYVYNDQGYAGRWFVSPEREQLNVWIYRIFINGKAPTSLPSSDNNAVKVSFDTE